jgi:hypothetical protein
MPQRQAVNSDAPGGASSRFESAFVQGPRRDLMLGYVCPGVGHDLKDAAHAIDVDAHRRGAEWCQDTTLE